MTLPPISDDRIRMLAPAEGAGPRSAAEAARLLNWSLFYWVGRLEACYNTEFVRRMRPLRVTVSRFRVLAALTQLDGLTVGELAQHTLIERTALGRLVDRMETEGLLVRGTRSSDRRAAEISISPKGMAVFEEMKPVRRRIMSEALEGIEPAEVAHAIDVVRRMLNNMEIVTSASADREDEREDEPVAERG